MARLPATVLVLAAGACAVKVDYGDPANPGPADGSGGAGIDALPVDARVFVDAAMVDAPPLPADGSPPVILTVGDNPDQVHDTEIWGADPSGNYSTVEHLSIDDQESGLVRFDLPQLPASATVLAARLILTTADLASPDGGTVLVYRLREDWNEGSATWLERDAGVPWATEGAEPPSRDDVVLAQIAPLDTDTVYTASLPTELVQEWLVDRGQNAGIVVVRGTSTNHVHFRTRESGAGWPLLEIEYQ